MTTSVTTNGAGTTQAPHVSLREHARLEAERVAADHAERARRRAEEDREHAIGYLVRRLAYHLSIDVDPGSVAYDAAATPPAMVLVDGVTFGIAREAYYDEDLDLAVRIECARGCGKPLWKQVDGLLALNTALAQPHTHGFDCLAIYDEDGEITGYLDGRPAPVRPAPPLTPEQRAAKALAAINAAAQDCARAHAHVQELEDARALVKRDAIKRLMESGAATSASAAEKIVEQDEGYAAHRAQQRDAEFDRWRSLAAWEAAKVNARMEAARYEHSLTGAD